MKGMDPIPGKGGGPAFKDRLFRTTLLLGLLSILSPRIFIGQPAYRLAVSAVFLVCMALFYLFEIRNRP